MRCAKLFRDYQTVLVIFEYVDTSSKVRLGLKRKCIFLFSRRCAISFPQNRPFILRRAFAPILRIFSRKQICISEYIWENWWKIWTRQKVFSKKQPFLRKSTKIQIQIQIFFSPTGLFVSHDNEKFCHFNKKLQEIFFILVNIFVNFVFFRSNFLEYGKVKLRKKFLENVKTKISFNPKDDFLPTFLLLRGRCTLCLDYQTIHRPQAQCLMVGKHWYFFNIARLGSFIQSA